MPVFSSRYMCLECKNKKRILSFVFIHNIYLWFVLFKHSYHKKAESLLFCFRATPSGNIGEIKEINPKGRQGGTSSEYSDDRTICGRGTNRANEFHFLHCVRPTRSFFFIITEHVCPQ